MKHPYTPPLPHSTIPITRWAMGQPEKSQNVYRCIQIICLKTLRLPVCLVSWRSSRLINLQFRPTPAKKSSPFLPVPTVVLTGHCMEVCSILQGWLLLQCADVKAPLPGKITRDRCPDAQRCGASNGSYPCRSALRSG
jgi:hypothetical protein